jgi:RimJ/RimL family protein N-acetyltransferase
MDIYRALSTNEFANDEYTIIPIREIDILEIKRWRNEQIDILRQRVILSDQDQKEYYHKHVVPGFSAIQPKLILFSFLERHTCIGYGGLTNIDWENKRAELSFLLQTELATNVQRYRKDFSNFLHLIKRVAFAELNLHRIFTETYDIRADHVLVLEENGFTLEGRLRQHAVVRGRFVDSLIHGCLRENSHA